MADMEPKHKAGGGTPQLGDLRPAQWIWYPSSRCLHNTFVLFRRELRFTAKPRRATGWVSADSRYLLTANGERIQWGPPPCDPRWLDADPVDLTNALREGLNVLGATVLYYGQGEGTYAMGKPGFLLRLEIEHADGRVENVVSDGSWLACLPRSWKPGHYARWYLRALQEEFDARLYPYGWNTAKFKPDGDWLPAMAFDSPPNMPPICSGYDSYLLQNEGDRTVCQVRPRTIAMMAESLVPIAKLTESMWLRWRRPAEEYFACGTPNAFECDRSLAPRPVGDGAWAVELDGERGAALTFEWGEQIVGWPFFTIEAPAGTTVELLVQEAHKPGGEPLLNTHFHSWTRFVCREGENRFETFDFESARWLQLHIHNAKGKVVVRDIGMRRRVYPWPNRPQIDCSDASIQTLVTASVNTLNNCAQETLVDGMARERQQYSGDCGHQIHAIFPTFGETRQPARYIRTYSQGLTKEGYFLDCWPAYDRLHRVMQRQVNQSGWGPILDHGVGFNFDCWYYHLYTGDAEPLNEAYPRLLRFADYLRSIRKPDGLLPVESRELGTPCVWIDHDAYRQQRHKQCAFNLYAAAAMEHALAPLARLFDERDAEQKALTLSRELLAATVERFWSAERGLFVNNLPWIREDGGERLCDRSLATAVLFGQCPGGKTDAAIKALADGPPTMGLSYPANAGWRLWALGEAGRADVILKEFRTRWMAMDSVRLNNTLQEGWTARPDSGDQWSHCPVAPLYVLYMTIAGIRPLAPGFARCEIRPQPADLERLALTAHTVKGPIRFECTGKAGSRALRLTMPTGCEGELVVPKDESPALDAIAGEGDLRRYRLPGGKTFEFVLRRV